MGRRRRSRRTDQAMWRWLALAGAAVLAFALLAALVRSSAGIVLGLGCLAAAVMVGRVGADRRIRSGEHSADLATLSALSPLEFEAHVAGTYRSLGYRTDMTPGSGDQGVDVIAANDTERVAIQCKRWSGNVGNDAVQAVHAGKDWYHCTRAAVVCITRFTPSAVALADRLGVELIDGDQYATRVRNLRNTETTPTRNRLLAWMPGGRPTASQVGLAAAGIVLLAWHFSGGTGLVGPIRPGSVNTGTPDSLAEIAHPQTVGIPPMSSSGVPSMSRSSPLPSPSSANQLTPPVPQTTVFGPCPTGDLPAPGDTTGLCLTANDALPASCRSPQTATCLSYVVRARAQITCYVRNGGMPTGVGLAEDIATACELDPAYTAPPPGTVLVATEHICLRRLRAASGASPGP